MPPSPGPLPWQSCPRPVPGRWKRRLGPGGPCPAMVDAVTHSSQVPQWRSGRVMVRVLPLTEGHTQSGWRGSQVPSQDLCTCHAVCNTLPQICTWLPPHLLQLFAARSPSQGFPDHPRPTIKIAPAPQLIFLALFSNHHLSPSDTLLRHYLLCLYLHVPH